MPPIRKRCQRFVIHPSLSSTPSKRKIVCWMQSKERNPKKNIDNYLNRIKQMKNTSIEASFKYNYTVIIDGNCPFLYFWLSNNKTTQSFINHNLLHTSYMYSSPIEKMRILVQIAYHSFFNINPEVNQIKYSYKQQLMEYFIQHSYSKGMNYHSFNQYIGLHIRMGTPYSDFKEVFTYLNPDDLKVAVSYINSLNSSYPIYLATDSFYAKQYFSSIYRDRVVYYSSPVNYTTDTTMMKKQSSHISNSDYLEKLVMVDLLLLSESSYLVGTDLSTFSTMASLIGNATTVFIKKSSPVVCTNCYTVHDY